MMPTYPRRLIEVDLPIARVSTHARREKSIRHGHISTLHAWWARRPLAACRAVICASLWPDPVDLDQWEKRGGTSSVVRSSVFMEAAKQQMTRRLQLHLAKAGTDSLPQLMAVRKDPTLLDDPAELRAMLLDFIADFACWENANDPDYLSAARALTAASHAALGRIDGGLPLVIDPFAGGGSIPLEALRVGARAFASDLNPVATLLNKVVLEWIPKYGPAFADEVRQWGDWVKQRVSGELLPLYSPDADGATPIAYLWSRTVRCEGPGCGTTVPLLASTWIARKPKRRAYFEITSKGAGCPVELHVVDGTTGQPSVDGTVKRGSATCPACGFTMQPDRVRRQLRARSGGTKDALLTAVVLNHPRNGTLYRGATDSDVEAVRAAEAMLESPALAGLVPTEATPDSRSHRSVASLQLYGMYEWKDIYTTRQLVTLTSLARAIRDGEKHGMPFEVQAMLALCLGKLSDYSSSLCLWRTARTCVRNTFGRQALALVWDFGEMNPFAGSAGDWSEAISYVSRLIESLAPALPTGGEAVEADATRQVLPDDSADLLFTDPPYYDAVVYAELADYFYVWHKRSMPSVLSGMFSRSLTPKDQQAVVYHPSSTEERARYQSLMTRALEEGRRTLAPDGMGVFVFAHKSTAGWEAMLQSVLEAGWQVVASWPLDTERGGRVNAVGTASLSSSIHLVCRPRETPDGALDGDVGEWREVLEELPARIHEWMPRLSAEGIVGADAIFACLGPALSIFSRYATVEKASGETVGLSEYLEQVWAAVSKEALAMIFRDPATAGLEPEARLTAMWLWTMAADSGSAQLVDAEEDRSDGEPESAGAAHSYSMEFDAARKIAQGLGIHLEKATTVVQVVGGEARLLSVAERARYLFGRDAEPEKTNKGRGRGAQLDLFAELREIDTAAASPVTELAPPDAGRTVLDRVHQSMILFGAGRSEALRRFLVEEGVGKKIDFWKLAQALSALYPPGSDEKRWVDGVLARKKGLGL